MRLAASPLSVILRGTKDLLPSIQRHRVMRADRKKFDAICLDVAIRPHPPLYLSRCRDTTPSTSATPSTSEVCPARRWRIVNRILTSALGVRCSAFDVLPASFSYRRPITRVASRKSGKIRDLRLATSGRTAYGRTSTRSWAWLTAFALEVKVQSRVLPSELPRPRSQERPPPKRLKQRIACFSFQLWICIAP